MKNHPIIPPHELVRQWDKECDSGYNPEIDNTFDALKCFASKAAQWGADQELEACCEVLARELICDGKHVATDLRTVRRPKPPSLKEQALDAWDRLRNETWCQEIDYDLDFIRRALEALDD